MPTDSRRLNGPSECFSPYDFCSSADSDSRASTQVTHTRPDGRSNSELRPMFLKAGVVSQARGSAYIEMGKTKVICAVYGPREVLRREDFNLMGQLTCDFKFLTFSCDQRRQHQQDEQEKDMSVRILEAMEPAVCLNKYPKSQINIYIMVLQSDGTVLAAAITGASVALASAGVEMYDLVLASSVAQQGAFVLSDPTSQEENDILNKPTPAELCAGTFTVAFLPYVNQISTISSDGHISSDTLKQHLHVCVGNCQKVHPVVCQSLVAHLQETRSIQR